MPAMRPTKALRVALVVLMMGALSACSEQASPTSTSGEPVEGPTPEVEDGEWFAFVTVGEDESGVPTLGVDLAEMLTGEEAREQAIEDGVIEEGEDLPNDFYIHNPERDMELLQVEEGAAIEVVSGDDTSQMLDISLDQLEALYKGEYVGSPVYGVVPNTPIPMNVTVAGGLINDLRMVYLP